MNNKLTGIDQISKEELKNIKIEILNGSGSTINLTETKNTLEDIGFNSDAKEAFAFAVLGYLSVTGKPGNVKTSTGAKYDMVLGEVTLAKIWRE